LALGVIFAPALQADEAEWKAVKATVVLLNEKADYISPVFRSVPVGGDSLSFPVEGGSLAIVVSTQKVMVDHDLNGKADFVAAQGAKSTPFTLPLTYSDGQKVKHTYAVVKAGAGWALKRMSGMSANIDGNKALFVDENNNGRFSESNEDAVFPGTELWGCPTSDLMLLGGKLYEVKTNESCTEVSYRPYAGKTGKVDIFKDWSGKTTPKTAIFKVSCESGSMFMNVATKGEVVVPTGNYNLMIAYMPEIVIQGGNASFSVGEESTATFKWGMKLSINAALSVDDTGKKFTLSPTPTITGIAGERITGAFMENARFAFKVTNATANGAPIGKETPWSVCFS
jgi:hypothetical protein